MRVVPFGCLGWGGGPEEHDVKTAEGVAVWIATLALLAFSLCCGCSKGNAELRPSLETIVAQLAEDDCRANTIVAELEHAKEKFGYMELPVRNTVPREFRTTLIGNMPRAQTPFVVLMIRWGTGAATVPTLLGAITRGRQASLAQQRKLEYVLVQYRRVLHRLRKVRMRCIQNEVRLAVRTGKLRSTGLSTRGPNDRHDITAVIEGRTYRTETSMLEVTAGIAGMERYLVLELTGTLSDLLDDFGLLDEKDREINNAILSRIWQEWVGRDK